jgi:hypothetical protein
MRRIRLSLAIGALLALTLAGPALAARPTREIIDVGTPEIEALISEHLSETCDFEISVDADATIAVMVFSNNDGSFRREIDGAQLKWTLTNAATGVSIGIHSVGPDIYWVTRDGVTMLASIGRAYLPHDGSGFIGRLLVNLDTGEVLASPSHMTGDIAQLVCAPLAH